MDREFTSHHKYFVSYVSGKLNPFLLEIAASFITLNIKKSSSMHIYVYIMMGNQSVWKICSLYGIQHIIT
jgi:hypothetical protein